MYSKELKKEIVDKLLRSDKRSTNLWIYIPSYLEKNNLNSLLEKIKNVTPFLDNRNRLDEKIYCVLNDINKIPTCCCGNEVKFKRFQLGFAEYCSVKCRANSKKWLDQYTNTMQIKYGVDRISQTEYERKKRSAALKIRQPSMDYSNAGKKYRETIARLYGPDYNPGWNEKGIATRINNKNMVPLELLDEYKEYYRRVARATKKQYLAELENFSKRGVLHKNNDAYHIDHMFSVYDGFMNDVPAEIVGHLSNLQCIPGRANIKKGNESSLTIEDLYKKYNAYK